MKHLLLIPALAAALALAPSAQSLSFAHGTDMHVDVGPSPLLVPATGITVEAWMTYDEAGVPTGTFRWPTLCRMDPTPGQEKYMIRVDAGSTGIRSIRFMVRTQNNGSVSASTTFTLGQFANWTHIAGTYDGTRVRLFLDGVEVSSTAATGPLVTSPDVLRIGNGDVSSPGAEVWSGNVDEFRVWPFARTAEEILATKDLELAAMPGGVLTFNCNGNSSDTSSSINGTGTGAFTYDASTPTLNAQFSSAGPFGASSSSCGLIRTALGSLPSVGNAVFRPRALGVSAGSAGLFFAALGSLPTPVTVAGLDIVIDPALIRVTIPVSAASPLGVAQAFAGIPNDPALAGRVYFSQFLVVDGACGFPNLTSSEGLALTVLP